MGTNWCGTADNFSSNARIQIVWGCFLGKIQPLIYILLRLYLYAAFFFSVREYESSTWTCPIVLSSSLLNNTSKCNWKSDQRRMCPDEHREFSIDMNRHVCRNLHILFAESYRHYIIVRVVLCCWYLVECGSSSSRKQVNKPIIF